ncbi:hypothetical protein C1645_819795, partial [Glomus cerebriforme]
HGTGKTTLIRRVSREVGQGIIYVEISSDPKNKDIDLFGKAFGESLNFKFEEHISFIAQLKNKILGINGKVDRRPKWRRALEAFKSASAVYKAKHNKLPVIIYDNISEIMNSILILARSAWSRADKPVMEISDLSKEESIKYLVDKRKIKDKEAKKLYELVGGRIIDLKSVADKFLAKQSFEVIKKQVFDAVFDNLETAEMNPGQSNHEAAKIIIKTLINSNDMLHISKLREMTKVEPSKDFRDGTWMTERTVPEQTKGKKLDEQMKPNEQNLNERTKWKSDEWMKLNEWNLNERTKRLETGRTDEAERLESWTNIRNQANG